MMLGADKADKAKEKAEEAAKKAEETAAKAKDEAKAGLEKMGKSPTDNLTATARNLYTIEITVLVLIGC